MEPPPSPKNGDTFCSGAGWSSHPCSYNQPTNCATTPAVLTDGNALLPREDDFILFVCPRGVMVLCPKALLFHV